MKTAATLITGSLGVGKTTAILDLMARHGDGGWAVLVNEFGRVGIDAAAFPEGLAVREVAGGCICCTAGVALRATLVRMLRELRPTRLLIEPTGLAHPATVLDLLRSPGLAEAVDLKATITLVDPRRCAKPPPADDPWHDQIECADVLVANRCDLAGPDDLAAFRALAAQRWPPLRVTAETEQGRLDPAWLDLDPGHAPPAPRAHLHSGPTAPPLRTAQGWRLLGGEGRVLGCGYIWPATRRFDARRLQEALQGLVAPGGLLPLGALRLKGVFQTDRGWRMVDATTDAITWRPSGHRSDCRAEVLVDASQPPDWDAVEAALLAATV